MMIDDTETMYQPYPGDTICMGREIGRVMVVGVSDDLMSELDVTFFSTTDQDAVIKCWPLHYQPGGPYTNNTCQEVVILKSPLRDYIEKAGACKECKGSRISCYGCLKGTQDIRIDPRILPKSLPFLGMEDGRKSVIQKLALGTTIPRYLIGLEDKDWDKYMVSALPRLFTVYPRICYTGGGTYSGKDAFEYLRRVDEYRKTKE
jgi:hypothetical protein